MINIQKFSAVSTAIGVLLILIGILVPSSTLIEFLRSTRSMPLDLLNQLLLGSTLFKVGLIILGLVVITLNQIPIGPGKTQEEQSLSKKQPKFYLIILGIILMIAFVLRLYKLDSGLWLDEIATMLNYGSMSFGEIVSTYDSQNQHFLYSLLARATLVIFGHNAWALRLPAVFFGLASIIALYLLGREVRDSQEALFASALLAFSYHHIWFSQNARGYTGLLFWTLLSSWFLVRGLREERPSLWILYAISATLGAYTHMTMVFTITGHFVIYLIVLFTQYKDTGSGKWMGLFLGFGLTGLLTLVLYALIVPQILTDFTAQKNKVVFTTWQNPFWTVLEIVRRIRIGFAGGFVALVGLFVFGIGCVSWFRKKPIVLQLLFIPSIICAIVVIGTGHNIWPRFFFFAVGFGILVVIRGIMALGQWVGQLSPLSTKQANMVGPVFATGLILVSGLSIPFVYGPKQDYQSALSFVEANQQTGDKIATAGLAAYVYTEYYQTNWVEVETVQALNQVRSEAQRTWFVYAFPPHLEAIAPEILGSVQDNFTKIESFYGTLGGGTVYVYRSDTSTVESSSDIPQKTSNDSP